MTNVSKKHLNKKSQQKLFNQFTNLFLSADETKLAQLFDAIFTDAEKIMFIKRVAIILMLSKGVSIYAVARSLKVSETTVRSQRSLLRSGKYNVLAKLTHNKSFDWDQFWEMADVLFRLGLPSYGKDRWRWLNKLPK